MEKVNLQLKTGGVPNVLHLSQYDTDRTYLFTPYYGSEAYEYQSGALVYVEATKPDKTIVVTQATYNTDGTVTYKLAEALTQVAGDVRAKLTWVKDEQRLASAEVIFACDAAGIDTYARISESDLETLHTAESKMHHIDESVTAAASSATAAATSASNAKTSASNADGYRTQAANSATAAATSATNAKTSETNAASSATAAATSASNAKTSETNAASSKTAAASSATAAKTSETNAAASATAAAASAKEAASAITGVKSLNSLQGDLSVGFDESSGDVYVEGESKTILGSVLNWFKANIATIKSAIGNATTSAAGLMTTTQVTKLNGIEEGATKTNIVNNLTATTAGSALDAVQGKALSDQISSLNSSLTTRSSNLTKCKISNTDESNRLFLIDFEGELLGGAAGYVRVQFIVMTNQIVVNCKNSDGAWTKVATYTAN